MISFLEKIINRAFSTIKRPSNSVLQLTNQDIHWGKYLCFNTINTLIFIIDFFIQRLEKSGIKPNQRLLKITELNLIELYGLRQSILVQVVNCKITLTPKDCFVKLTNGQRQDMSCILTDYELIISKTFINEKSLYQLSEEYSMVTELRIALNNMYEIKPQDN